MSAWPQRHTHKLKNESDITTAVAVASIMILSTETSRLLLCEEASLNNTRE
jgi:hypothetical protein